MNNELVQIFIEIKVCYKTLSEILSEYNNYEILSEFDYDFINDKITYFNKESLRLSQRLSKFNLSAEQITLYQNIAELMLEEKYEEIAILKKLIDELETNELLHTNI